MKVFEEPFDPSDEQAYEMDLADGLGEGEVVTAFVLAVAEPGAAWGVSVREDGDFAAELIDDGTAIRFYPAVAEDERAAARWRGFGRRVVISASVTTNAEPWRGFERSFALRVRQQ